MIAAMSEPAATLRFTVIGFAREVNLLVLESSFATDEQAARRHGHMTAGQAGGLASRAGAKRLLLTHRLPGAGPELAELAARHFGGPIDLAREGLVYELP